MIFIMGSSLEGAGLRLLKILHITSVLTQQNWLSHYDFKLNFPIVDITSPLLLYFTLIKIIKLSALVSNLSYQNFEVKVLILESCQYSRFKRQTSINCYIHVVFYIFSFKKAMITFPLRSNCLWETKTSKFRLFL